MQTKGLLIQTSTHLLTLGLSITVELIIS